MPSDFFPAWSDDFNHHSRKLFGLAQSSIHQLQLHCASWIPAHRLSQEDEGSFSRVRRWPMSLTFWTFLWQVTHAGSSCRDAVRHAIALCSSEARPIPADDTPAYCTARSKLPIDRLQSIHDDLVKNAQAHIVQRDLWCGHRVCVVDSTCFTMADTPENQKSFPQQSVQKPGCGFPIARLLAFFCLSTGMITHWITGHWRHHELNLLPKLLQFFRPGDILLGDRGFGNFPVLVQCIHAHIQAVFRANTAMRKIDFRSGRRLGPNDRVIQLPKGLVRPKYFAASDWDPLPQTITVRVVKTQARVKGFRTKSVILVTTLLDPLKYPASELSRLYLRRWAMELSFRHIKSTLQMDFLSCKTPEMIEREMRMHILAHNIVRRIILEAARRHTRPIDRISFAGTLGIVRSYGEALLRVRSKKQRRCLEQDMYRMIAEDQVPLRPGRREPRAVKRRPKPYPWLTSHRKRFKETDHRSKRR